MNARMMTLLAVFAATCLTASEVVIKEGDSIAFMGDSLTQLGNFHKPNGYIHLVIEGLKAAGVIAVPIPVGIGGNTTRHMLARLEKDVISKKPVWMTLNSGINDAGPISVEEFGSNIVKIVDQASTVGIKVILMTTTVGAGENLEAPSSLKCLKFCDEFRKLAKERNLLLVDLNAVMSKELIERKRDGIKGLKLTYDGTHLNGLGNQIVAAEILRTLGVSEQQITVLRKRWDDYPFAVAMPEVSVNEYMTLKAVADKNGKTIDEQVSAFLSVGVAMASKPQAPVKTDALAGVSCSPKGLTLKNGDTLAILSGQSFEIWSWSPTGYTRLVSDELEKAGVKHPIRIVFEGQKTEQMLARLDADVIAKNPSYVLIIPGTSDYNPWAERNVSESFKTNLAEIVRKLKAANIKTILATSYAANGNRAFPLNLNVVQHNDAIRTLAQVHGVPLIDFVKCVDAENSGVPLDGSLAAKSVINQMFTGEILRMLGYSDKEVAACRHAWLDTPGAIQFMPSVSVNTYEKLKAAAQASGQDVKNYITEILRTSVDETNVKQN